MKEYKYEYYSQKTYSMNTNMNTILEIACHEYVKIFTNIFEYLKIFKYSNIFEYLRIIKPQDCSLPV